MGQTQRNKPFHSKYRPINLINIVGQDHIVSYFKKALKKSTTIIPLSLSQVPENGLRVIQFGSYRVTSR